MGEDIKTNTQAEVNGVHRIQNLLKSRGEAVISRAMSSKLLRSKAKVPRVPEPTSRVTCNIRYTSQDEASLTPKRRCN